MNTKEELRERIAGIMAFSMPSEVALDYAEKILALTEKGEEKIEVNDGICFVCGEKTNSLTGNPTKWAIYLPHIDGQKKHRYYHIGCLYPILKNLQPKDKGECKHEWNFCGTSSNYTSINNDYICQKCGLVKKQVVPIQPQRPVEIELLNLARFTEGYFKNKNRDLEFLYQDIIFIETKINEIIKFISEKKK